MNELTPVTNELTLTPPGDSRKAAAARSDAIRVIEEYQSELRKISSAASMLTAQKVMLEEDKAEIKEKIESFGVANSAALRAKLEEIKAKQTGDFFKLDSSVRLLENEISRLQGERGIWEKQVKDSEELSITLNANIVVYNSALIFLRDVSEVARQGIIEKMETFVTKALEKIFGAGLLKFKIDLKVKSNVPHAEFQLEDSLTRQTYSVLESFGGGVGDVVSIVLRLAMLEMQDPVNSGPVVLDECGKFISSDHQEKFGEFLREWSEQFKRQIILVTHKQEVLKHAHRVFKVVKIDDCSTVSVLEPGDEPTIRTEELDMSRSRSELMTALLENRHKDCGEKA